mmetsp:Transcript_11231/g.23903  ORF Transcript_11231/g.23903 Transcript_11231/m.23903 type:complete len:113 (-) Transcript_11231:12-350(-)
MAMTIILMVCNNSWHCSCYHYVIGSTMRKGSRSYDGDSNTSSHGTVNQSALKGIDHCYCPLIMVCDDDGDALEDYADGDVNAKRDGSSGVYYTRSFTMGALMTTTVHYFSIQ